VVRADTLGQTNRPAFFLTINAHQYLGLARGEILGMIEHEKIGSKVRDGQNTSIEDQLDPNVSGVAGWIFAMHNYEILLKKAQAYAARYQLSLGKQLGFGHQGTVWTAQSNRKIGKSALKIHAAADPYARELRAYQRLAERGVAAIERLKVPELLAFDEELAAIEMTVVTKPFLLDFGGAYLDRAPEFPEEILAQWREDKQEQFGSHWSEVESALQTLASTVFTCWIFIRGISPLPINAICNH
jgi:hypothetical protein